MMYQQIPTLIYSLQPRFKTKESVRITQSQYEQLNELVKDYCHFHDAPRLKGLVKRIQRRMQQHSDHHLWQTEYNFITDHLMSAMKEAGYCRNEDNSKSVISVLNRENSSDYSERRRSRRSDQMQFSQSVKQIFDKWLH